MITAGPKPISLWKHPATRIACAASLLGLILLALDFREVWNTLKGFDPHTVLLMMALNAGAFLLFTARWRIIAIRLGIRAPSPLFFRGILLGAFYGQFGPPLLVTEATRFHILSPFGDRWSVAASQVLDRLSGQIALLALAVLLMPLYFELYGASSARHLLIGAATMGLVFIVGLVVLQRWNRLCAVPPNRIRAILNPGGRPDHYVISFGIQLLLMLNLTLAADGTGSDHDSRLVFLTAPLVLSGVALLPITFADWGTREAAALLVFSITGMEAEAVVAASLVYGAANLLSALPGALFLIGFLFPRGKASRPSDPPDQTERKACR